MFVPPATLTYRRPGTKGNESYLVKADEGLAFGRQPGEGGLVLDRDDLTISSTAGRLLHAEQSWLLWNSSSYATLRLEGAKGFRYVHPGDRMALRDGDVIIVPADLHEHRLAIAVPEAIRAEAQAGETRPVVSRLAPLHDERRAAVAALVAGWFLTDRFDPVPLPSAEIARLLSTPDNPVTQKAVNHKLQRVRDAMSENLGVPIESRHMLADLVIQYRLVDIDDVRGLPGLHPG